jgi:NitT/TauT family transport system permease protein
MKKLLLTLSGIVLFIAFWQGLATAFDRNVIVPAPADTLGLFARLILSPDILVAAWQTGWKMLVALLLAILLGMPCGFVLGLSGTLYDLFRPVIMVIQAVPVVSWLSLVIFVWGIGWRGPIFITFVSLLPVTVLTTLSGVRSLDQNLLEMAQVYRVARRKILTEIYLGSLLPFISAILDVGIGQAWKVMLVAEYLCGKNGLGVKMLMARMNIDTPGVWAITLIAVLLGIITEHLIRFGTERITPQWTLP